MYQNTCFLKSLVKDKINMWWEIKIKIYVLLDSNKIFFTFLSNTKNSTWIKVNSSLDTVFLKSTWSEVTSVHLKYIYTHLHFPQSPAPQRSSRQQQVAREAALNFNIPFQWHFHWGGTPPLSLVTMSMLIWLS